MDLDEPPPLEMREGEDPWKRYEVLETLGEGGFGVIYKVREKSTGEMFAAKVVDVGDDILEVQKELEFINSCNHPNIIKCFDACRYNHKIYIFLECCEAGSVYDIIRVLKRDLTEEEISYIIKDSLEALVYLHKQQPVKCHRDMKSGNVLISDKGNILLTDFGVSAEINKETRKEVTGSSYWMAPEIIKGQTYDEKSDIWSLGITCIEMAEGRPPLSHKNTLKAMYLIPRLRPPVLKHAENFSKDFNDFIAQCLTKDPNQRPSSSKLLFTPFIHSLFTKRKKKIQVMKNLIGDVFKEFESYGGRKEYFKRKDEESLMEKDDGEEDGEVEFDDAWGDEEEEEGDDDESEDDESEDLDDDDESSSDAEEYEKSKIYRRDEMKKNDPNFNHNEKGKQQDKEDDYLSDSDDDKHLFEEEVKIGKLELSMSKKNLFEGMFKKKPTQIDDIRKRNLKHAATSSLKKAPPPPPKKNRPKKKSISKKRKSPHKRRRHAGKKVMIPRSRVVLKMSRFQKGLIWVNSMLWLIAAIFVMLLPFLFGGKEDAIFSTFMMLFGVFSFAMGISSLPIVRKYHPRESFFELAVSRTVMGLGFISIVILFCSGMILKKGKHEKEEESNEGFISRTISGLFGKNGDDDDDDKLEKGLQNGWKVFVWFVVVHGVLSLLISLVFWIVVVKGRRRRKQKHVKKK